MLCYRARLEGPIAAVVSLRAAPVRRRSGLGGGEGLSRVTLRYAVAPTGKVLVHRGWLYTPLPSGSRLQVVGYQVDGLELLVSLCPLRTNRWEPEYLTDRFCLPLRLESWGVASIRSLSARLQLNCRTRPRAVLLHGLLRLRVGAPDRTLCLTIPFARLLATGGDPELRWRAWGGVVSIACRVEPDGAVAGEVEVMVSCAGQPAVELPPPDLPAVAVVRNVTGQIRRVEAEHVSEGRVVVRGVVDLDLAWADAAGQSRWTDGEAPFSALLEIPGTLASDRLEPVAQIDRLSLAGAGAGSRAALLVAVGVTSLRTVHLALDGQWYRLEKVVGQAVTSLPVDHPLFARPDSTRLAPVPAAPRTATVPLPGGTGDGWRRLRLRLKPPATAGGGWRSSLALAAVSAATAPAPDEGGPADFRETLPLDGSLPIGAGAVLLDVQEVTPGGVRCRVQPLPVALRDRAGWEQPDIGKSKCTKAWIDLPGRLRATLGLMLHGGPTWEARALLRLADGLRLVAVATPSPGERESVSWEPVAVTAYGVEQGGEAPDRLCLEVWWR